MSKLSPLETKLLATITAEGLPEPEREFRFHPPRRWRLDFAYPQYKLAIEVEGGLFSWIIKCHNCGSVVMMKTKAGKFIPLRIGGGHSTGKAIEDDIEKHNNLALDGWMLIRIHGKMIKENGGAKAIIAIKTALILRGWHSYENI